MFDLSESKMITLEEMTMMLINIPDMGFSCTQNINIPDRFYQNIKEATVKCIVQ